MAERLLKTANFKLISTIGVALLSMATTCASWAAEEPASSQRRTISPDRATPQLLTTTKLKIVEGSKEFESLVNELSLSEPRVLKFQWTTGKSGAVSGRWQVRDLAAGNSVVANGVSTPAPAPGHFQRFTISPTVFLSTSLPDANTKYEISITPYDAQNKAIDKASRAVSVTQLSAANVPPPLEFDQTETKFPQIEVTSYTEKIGQVPLTQLFYAYADIKIRAANPLKINPGILSGISTGVSVQNNRVAAEAGRRTEITRQATPQKTKSDPMWLRVSDHSLLFRQGAPVSIPALDPGQTLDIDIRLDAILPPARSQTPGAQQHREWRRQYADRCGPEWRSALEWRGNQNDMPLDPRREALLPAPGWAEYTQVPPSVPVCANNQCVKLCDIEKSIRAQLDGKSVGYGYAIGGLSPKFGSGGYARTQANAPAIKFTPKTRITTASVSKWVTSIAAMRILADNDVDLDDPIGPFYPSDWEIDQFLQDVTFAQLMSHTSGIKDYGNGDQPYSRLKTFFTQTVDPNSTTACQGSNVANPPNAITPNNMGGCYSNYNFAIMRLLLPRVAGFDEDPNLETRPRTLADQYEQLIQQNVFARIGVEGPACRPVGNSYAYGYKFPGDEGGVDWGDVSLRCGDAGWYLSAEDMAKILFSINARDGRILAESPAYSSFNDMRMRSLGIDNNSAAFMEKNGAWGANGTLITTSAAIFGPVTGPNVIAVLFVNSDIDLATGDNARAVLRKAYNDSLTPE